jgi:hypothetical protein
MLRRMDTHADRARSFAFICLGVAATILALAALLVAVSWRQHYGPCPNLNSTTKSVSSMCAVAPYSQ